MRILVAVEPADFRKGIDGLAQVCRDRMQRDPFDGAVFVFRNRRATAVKILVYDGQGFWLCQKRLSKGRFRWWPARPPAAADGGTGGPGGRDAAEGLGAHQLSVLLYGGNPAASRGAAEWRPITVGG
jgi:hypothetical protein